MHVPNINVSLLKCCTLHSVPKSCHLFYRCVSYWLGFNERKYILCPYLFPISPENYFKCQYLWTYFQYISILCHNSVYFMLWTFWMTYQTNLINSGNKYSTLLFRKWPRSAPLSTLIIYSSQKIKDLKKWEAQLLWFRRYLRATNFKDF